MVLLSRCSYTDPYHGLKKCHLTSVAWMTLVCQAPEKLGAPGGKMGSQQLMLF